MSLKDNSYLELWQPLCAVKRNHLCNFGRRHHEEQFCEIILNLDQWCKDISYLELWQPFFSAERNLLCNFCWGYHEAILWYYFEFGPVVQEMSFKRCLIRSSGGPCVWWSGTIYAILVEGIMGTFMWRYFKFGPVVQKEMLFNEKVYACRTKTDHNSSPWAFG